MRFTREPIAAGATPSASPLTTVAAKQNASTYGSTAKCIHIGSESGSSVWNARTATHAMAAPPAPPAEASSRLSARNPFVSSNRPAPSAVCSTYCLCCVRARATSRLATLKMQISRTNDTPPVSNNK